MSVVIFIASVGKRIKTDIPKVVHRHESTHPLPEILDKQKHIMKTIYNTVLISSLMLLIIHAGLDNHAKEVDAESNSIEIVDREGRATWWTDEKDGVSENSVKVLAVEDHQLDDDPFAYVNGGQDKKNMYPPTEGGDEKGGGKEVLAFPVFPRPQNPLDVLTFPPIDYPPVTTPPSATD